jgi:hypothetical protein
MKLNKKIKTTMSLAAAMGTLALTAISAQAAVILQFEESGGNVTATLTGTIDLTGLTRHSDNDSSGPWVLGNGSSLYILNDGSVGPHDRYASAGAATASGLSATPDSLSGGEPFGFGGSAFFSDGGTPLNDPAYAPSGTFTWNGTTLAGIGLSALTTTPTTVWTITEAGGSGDTIQFALAPVPEPSTTALLGLGGLALILRRRK